MQYRTSLGVAFSEWQLEDQFEDYLNDTEIVNVIGFTFGAGGVLRKVSPIAFRDAFLRWVNGRLEDGELEEI